MSDHVVFEDNHIKIQNVIKDKAIAFLNEIGGEIRSQAQRNSRRDTSQTAGSYQYKVDESNLAVHIGSDLENAVWEEFGTGVHALNDDGRKGYWVYVKGGTQHSTHPKTYSTVQEAKKVMAILRSKGLEAYYTNGKKANRPLWKAYESTKAKIKQRAEQIFGG